MATAANIVLADSTPTNHTFVPIVAGPGLTIHEEQGLAQTPSGNLQLTSSLDVANSKRPTDRIKFQLVYPVEQTVDGVTSVAYTARAFVEAAVPVQMTVLQRTHLAALVASAASNAVVKLYYNRQPMY